VGVFEPPPDGLILGDQKGKMDQMSFGDYYRNEKLRALSLPTERLSIEIIKRRKRIAAFKNDPNFFELTKFERASIIALAEIWNLRINGSGNGNHATIRKA